MEILAGQIKHALELQNEINRCAVGEQELQRIWPLNEKDRETKIEQFTKNYGLQLTFYRRGLCAIFERELLQNRE